MLPIMFLTCLFVSVCMHCVCRGVLRLASHRLLLMFVILDLCTSFEADKYFITVHYNEIFVMKVNVSCGS